MRVEQRHRWSSTFACFSFSFLFLPLCFPVGGFCFVLFCFCCVSLISLRRNLLGQRADGHPAPGQGPPMNVRLQSPARASRVLATPPAAGLWSSEVDTTEQECTEMTSLGIELRDNNLH